MSRATVAVITLFLALLASSGGAVFAEDPVPKVDAKLIAPTTAIHPGRPFTVGLHQKITPQWHTYWNNPGDSGEPTRLTWKLPEGFAASAINWPIPEAIPVEPLMNYGYSGEVLLPLVISPPATIHGRTAVLEAHAEWLVCEKICIPEQKTVRLALEIAPLGSPLPSSPHAAMFEATHRMQPVDIDWPVRVEAVGEHLQLSIAATDLEPNKVKGAWFFPDTWGKIDHAGPQPLGWSREGFALTLNRGETAREGIPVLTGVLVLTEQIGERTVRNGFRIDTAADASPLSAGAPDASTGLSLWQAAFFALLGGLILNLMPCVLPILSLKVMALAGHGGKDAGAGTRSGIAYLAGVLASFAALAALLLVLRGAGETLGWGFQFQSPAFVLAMSGLFFALALSLSGVFDIGGNIIGTGESLTRRGGLAGSFFTGVLATIAATPCTAPFMGAAIGFALARPAIELITVLLALGIGFALPVTALSISGQVQRFVPRPGPWMVTLKQALAFPLYATVAWLVWVLSLQTGSDGVLAAAVVLLSIAFAGWLLGLGGGRPLVRSALAAAVIAVSAPLALTQFGSPGASEAGTTARPDASTALSETYSPERVAALRAEGRPVFVNFTAAWCISCKVNERLALKSDGFRRALDVHNAAYLTGDWTNKNDQIAAVLKSFGRAGVPLYLLYPADVHAEPIVLPQLLTESIVVDHFASLSPQAPHGLKTNGD